MAPQAPLRVEYGHALGVCIEVLILDHAAWSFPDDRTAQDNDSAVALVSVHCAARPASKARLRSDKIDMARVIMSPNVRVEGRAA
jgi:hypothetical protein